LFLYDTFEGMTQPDPAVDINFSGNEAVNDWREVQRRWVKWVCASVEEVQETIASSRYPMEKVKFVKGRVEETSPGDYSNLHRAVALRHRLVLVNQTRNGTPPPKTFYARHSGVG
jgi:hypothetical protein